MVSENEQPELASRETDSTTRSDDPSREKRKRVVLLELSDSEFSPKRSNTATVKAQSSPVARDQHRAMSSSPEILSQARKRHEPATTPRKQQTIQRVIASPRSNNTTTTSSDSLVSKKASVSAAAFKTRQTSVTSEAGDKRKSLNEFVLPTTPTCVRRRHARATAARHNLFSSDDEDDYSAAFRSKTAKVRKKAKMTSSAADAGSDTAAAMRPPRRPNALGPVWPEMSDLLADCK